jgi:cation:H+ antiporter
VADLVALLLMLGIPQIVIGYMLVFLGTGTPELFVSLISTIQVNLGVAGTNDLTVSIVMASRS